MTMFEQRRGTTHVNLDLGEVKPQELLRVQRLARELRLTDQILSVDLDTVNVDAAGPAPAWTTLEGDKVTFAYNQMPKPVTRLDVAVWLGTNAHELGHVLYSPRRGSTLMFRVIESDRTFMPGAAMLTNIVEDQRQERLILGRFSAWRGYLTAALGHHLTPDDDSAWLLMAGRTWLPDAVRDQAKARMLHARGQHVTDEVTRLIGEYQHLTDPGESEVDEAWSIVQALHALFADDMPRIPMHCTVMEAGEPDVDGAAADQDVAPRAADDVVSDDRDGAGVDADDDDDDDGDGAGDSPKPKPSERSGDGGGVGAGSQPADRSADVNEPIGKDTFKRQLRDAAAEQIDNDEDASGDLDAIVESLDSGRGGDAAEGADATGYTADATDVALRLHHEIGDALLDLKDESEPGWLRRTDSGRLNVRRLASPDVNADELFDRYEPGMMDASELEVVLLLDVSGSMGHAVRPLAEATWAIRHAVDDLEGSITVFTFDSGPHEVLAHAGERPDGRMFIPRAKGGTDPTSALTEAFRVIAGSQARNRLVIILTDGDWYGRRPDDVIRAMNDEGVTTVIAWLGIGVAKPDQHGCQFGAPIADPIELARLFRRVAAERIRSWR